MRHVLSGLLNRVARVGTVAQRVTVLGRAGILDPLPPSVLRCLGAVVKEWGIGPAGGFAAMALRAPDRACVIDDVGTTTWAQMHRRGNAVARGLAGVGVGPRGRVGILCRNHRGFIDAMLGTSRLGADIVFLNTALAGPALRELLAREGVNTVVHDAEFAAALTGAVVDGRPVVGVVSDDPTADGPNLPGFVHTESDEDLSFPGRLSRIVLLTSGTSGTPKGAPRREAGPDAAVALLSRMPLRAGWRTHIAAPLFHTWGLAHLLLAMLLGSTMVLRRRFDPEECLTVLASERCESLVVIPVMLQRILHLPATDDPELPDLTVVASSGSALPGNLALEWMDRFGDTLHSIYGSTEVACASVATPADLRRDPNAAGRAPANTTLRILDHAGQPVPPGECGRVFVGNSLLMPGYTHGDSPQMVQGLMDSGDLGRLDERGVLHLQGRDDEMIVSGGENVFPAEVEHCLARHPWVLEVAAVGLDDAEFGQRLRAFVVLDPEAAGHREQVPEVLQLWVREHLARYKVPRDVVLVPALPRNATGKVLKRELAARTE